MKTIFSVIFVIFFLSMLPLGHSAFIDDSKVLENGYFLLENEKTFISSFEIREFEFGPLIRISGLTSSELPFYIIENLQSSTIRGFVITPSEIIKFQFENSLFLEDTNNVENNQDSNTVLNYLVSHSTRINNNDVFRFAVKTFDMALYDGNFFDTNFGKLNGVNVEISITNQDSKIMKNFNGTTQNGVFEGIAIIDDSWVRGTYFLNLELNYDGKIYHTSEEFFVLGDRSKGD